MLLTVFALFAGVALVSAIIVVLHRNPVVSTMSLVVTLVATAGLFIMLGSPFLAALQILLYTGAILVLFLFVIMLLNVQRERTTATRMSAMFIGAGICALVFAGALVRLFWSAYADTAVQPLDPEAFSLVSVARDLFGTYLLPFEMIGLLLLVAVVAASWVAKKPDAADDPDASEVVKQGEPR
ncbi:MAG: NADH-quinone oxidoreductase subunit J [Ferruginibacter sp.]